MNKVIPLFSFGLGLVCLGFYWHIYNDAFTMHLSQYVLTSYTAFGVSYTSDKYYDFMYMVWRLLPWLCVIIGVGLLIAAGVEGNTSQGGASE